MDATDGDDRACEPITVRPRPVCARHRSCEDESAEACDQSRSQTDEPGMTPAVDGLAPTPALWLLLNLAVLFVGLSKGGLPAIAMLSVPLLSLVMSPVKAAALLLPIYILTDAVGVYLYRHHYSARNLAILMPSAVVGVFAGWATAAFLPDRAIGLLIGSAGYRFLPEQVVAAAGRRHRGTCQGRPRHRLGNAGRVHQFRLARGCTTVSDLRAAATARQAGVRRAPPPLLFAVVNLAKIVPYAQLQPYTRADVNASLLLIPTAMIGTVAGAWLTRRIPDRWFFLGVQIALFLICLRLVQTALMPIDG